MAQVKQITVSSEGLKKLQEELEYLKTIKRKEVAENIKTARSFGDLSENSEYDEAKDEQGKVEKRIADIEAMLTNIRVVDGSDAKTDVASIGSKVKILYVEDNEEAEYTIVGPTEADPLTGKISDDSPVGSSILGKKQGEEFIVETPGGNITIRIISISRG
jgi:transcription elongation factor GreA